MTDQTFLEDYFTEEQAAAYVNRKPRTIKSWRDERRGPPVTYLFNIPHYRKESLKAWLLSLEGKPPRTGRRRKVAA